MTPAEKDRIAAMVLALVTRVGEMADAIGPERLRSAELMTVGPEAKVPYPSCPQAAPEKVPA